MTWPGLGAGTSENCIYIQNMAYKPNKFYAVGKDDDKEI